MLMSITCQEASKGNGSRCVRVHLCTAALWVNTVIIASPSQHVTKLGWNKPSQTSDTPHELAALVFLSAQQVDD